MFNPSNSYPGSGSYEDILKRMTGRVKQTNVEDQVLAILQQIFEVELGKENVVLSRPERVRLYQQLANVILTEVQGRIGEAK